MLPTSLLAKNHLYASTQCLESWDPPHPLRPDFSSYLQDLMTPLHFSAMYGRSVVCQKLLERGADVDAINMVDCFLHPTLHFVWLLHGQQLHSPKLALPLTSGTLSLLEGSDDSPPLLLSMRPRRGFRDAAQERRCTGRKE